MTTSVVSGVPSLFPPVVASRLSSWTLNIRLQPAPLAMSWTGGVAVNTISFVALPPPETLEVHVTPVQVELMLVSPT